MDRGRRGTGSQLIHDNPAVPGLPSCPCSPQHGDQSESQRNYCSLVYRKEVRTVINGVAADEPVRTAHCGQHKHNPQQSRQSKDNKIKPEPGRTRLTGFMERFD